MFKCWCYNHLSAKIVFCLLYRAKCLFVITFKGVEVYVICMTRWATVLLHYFNSNFSDPFKSVFLQLAAIKHYVISVLKYLLQLFMGRYTRNIVPLMSKVQRHMYIYIRLWQVIIDSVWNNKRLSIWENKSITGLLTAQSRDEMCGWWLLRVIVSSDIHEQIIRECRSQHS